MCASRLLKVTLFFAGVALSRVAFANFQTLPSPTVSNENASNSFLETYQSSLTKVNQMLSYINLSYIAIDMAKYNRAVSDVQKARVFSAQLETQSPTFVTENKLKYGKLTYDIKGQEVNYYIPETNGTFTVPDYDGFFTNTNSSQVVSRDARIVKASLDVDLQRTNNTLHFALSDLENQRYNSARVELAELHQNSLIGQTDIENPVWSIRDNLQLAQGLLDRNQYHDAQYALNHAREMLENFRRIAGEKNYANVIQKLSNAITAMKMRLQGKSPVTVQKAEREIHQWIHAVDGWTNTANGDVG